MKLPERAIVKVSACGIFTEPTFKSEMVNQALMWEGVLIHNKKDSWYKIQLKHDGYSGWIHEMYLTYAKDAFNIRKSCDWVQINEPAKHNQAYNYPCAIYRIRGVRYVIPVSLVHKIPCVNYEIYKKDNSLGAEIKLFFNNEIISVKLFDRSGSSAVVDWNQCIRQWQIPSFANDFIGYPYLWGGRSYQGYDCSGFIQTVFRYTNYNMPRDAKDQIKANFLEKIKLEDAYPGCLLFFKTNNTVNHVAMASQSFDFKSEDGPKYDCDEIIHASGSVCTISLEKSDLKDKLYKIMRLKDNE